MSGRRLATLALVAASGLVALGLCEVVLRAIGFSYPSLITTDDTLGRKLRPNAEGWYRLEGEAYIRINSDGLRDREHALEKGANTVRIAVLGDSFAEALQVPQEDTFWSVLEQELRRCSALRSDRPEVINFGVGGFSTAQELLTLRQHAWAYSPDIVLLAVFTENDIVENSKELGDDSESIRPFFVRENGALRLDMSFLDDPAYRQKAGALNSALRTASDHSKLFQLLNRVRGILSFTPVQDEVGDPALYAPPRTPAWQRAWEVTEDMVRLVRDETEQRGVRLLVVTLSNPIQANPDPQVRARYLEGVEGADLFYPDDRIRAFAEKEKIDVIGLARPLSEYAERTNEYLHGFANTVLGTGHWNAKGHHLAGQLIAKHLCSTWTQGETAYAGSRNSLNP